ncbi:MAG: Ada-Zn-binding domain-containing protein [Limosilactobacillus fermentum]
MKIIIVTLCLLTIGTLLWSLKQGNHAKRPFWWRLTLIIATLTLFTAAIGTTTNVDAAQKPTVIIKKLGHSSMVKESKAHDSLLVKRDSLSAKLASLKEQLSAAESSSEEASSKEAAASAQAASAQAASASQARANATDADTQPSYGAATSTTTAGTVATGNGSNVIVGDARSKKYHLPTQATYHIKAGNTVYFSTEQEAINAGYTKSGR